jgi:D-alanyl-D-alanine carboxypeptidase
MRRSSVALLAVLSLLLALGVAAPAEAALYPGGIVEQSYSRVWGSQGDVYKLTARLTVEVNDSGTEGRYRFRLQCFRTDGNTGSSGPHVCTFKFGDGQGGSADAFWISSGGTLTRDLTGESKTGTDELWVGGWHALSAGASYRVKIQDFYATFSGGPVGSFHTLESLTWTKPIRRPNGLSDLNAVFGTRCTDPVNNGRAFFPWANDSASGGYIYFHSKLTGIVANVRHRNDIDNRDGAYNRAVWGYACRQIAGSSKWSAHAWGVAIDINSVRNPQGDTSWDGVGSNGTNYGTYLPDLFTQSLIGNFYWGLNFSSNKDPMHFQYVTGY